MEQLSESTQYPQYLTFFIAREEYAVGILRVREIIQHDNVTRVPRTPPWVRGVINLRGSVVPVVDLAVKFGLQESHTTRSSCIVICEVQLEGLGVVMGIMADAVSQVIELPEHDVRPAPPFGTRVRVEYLQGVGRTAERLVLLLDVDKLLAADEVVAASSVGVQPGSELPAPISEPEAPRA